MSRDNTCLLLFDGPGDGPRNMAVDELLLEYVEQSQQPILRFYWWDEPTLSLGYFQSHRDRESHPHSKDLPWVRRPTGGGAIVHDFDLTYSLSVPRRHPLARSPQALYETMHNGLRETLLNWEIPVELHEHPLLPAGVPEPFLCFARRSVGDIVLSNCFEMEDPDADEDEYGEDYYENIKLGGSAQRRRKQSVLLHGSLLLGESTHAPELPGISERAGYDFDPEDFQSTCGERVLKEFGWKGVDFTPPKDWDEQIKKRVTTKFGTQAWNNRR